MATPTTPPAAPPAAAPPTPAVPMPPPADFASVLGTFTDDDGTDIPKFKQSADRTAQSAYFDSVINTIPAGKTRRIAVSDKAKLRGIVNSISRAIGRAGKRDTLETGSNTKADGTFEVYIRPIPERTRKAKKPAAAADATPTTPAT